LQKNIPNPIYKRLIATLLLVSIVGASILSEVSAESPNTAGFGALDGSTRLQLNSELLESGGSRGAHDCFDTEASSASTVGEGEYRLGWLPEEVPPVERVHIEGEGTLPTHLDWRDSAGIEWTTPIRSQGGCGSCVAFGAIGAFEAALRIKSSSPGWNIDLSEQHLFSCGGGACSYGWYISAALNYLRDYGTPSESCLPYRAKDVPCSDTCPDWQSQSQKIANWSWVANDVVSIETALQSGPVVAGFQVYQDFYSYSGGVYRHTSGKYVGGHCITIVGYDNTEGYWICKNSWGNSWGEKGYFRIAFTECGIENYVASLNTTIGQDTIGQQCTVTSSPVGPGFIRVDGTSITTPITFAWTAGTIHTLEALSPVSGGTGIRYLWTSWSSGGAQSHQYVVPESSQTVTAFYTTQYYLTVNSAHDSPTGSGWYDPDSTASFSVTSPVSGGTGIQYVCTGYSGDASGSGSSGSTIMDRAKTVTFNWKTQYHLTVDTYPNGLDAPIGDGWYDSGTGASASVSGISDHIFQFWYLDGQSTVPYSNNLATAVLMDAPHKITAYFKTSSTIALTVSSSSFNLGESTTLSGSIIPVRAGVSVKLNYSLDSGVSWTPFIIVKTDSDGMFGTVWTPPYPFTYLVRASWNGDSDYSGATSDSHTATVTGAMASQPRLQIALEDRALTRGQSITLTVTVSNPSDTILDGWLYVDIIGPGGYYHYDTIAISVAGRSEMFYDFYWYLPSNTLAGTYQVSTGLVPPWLGAYDVKYVQVG